MPPFKSRSKVLDGKPKGGVLSYLARMNDREVLEAVREIRRKRNINQSSDCIIPYSLTTEDISRCHDDADSTTGSNYTVEFQNENGDTDNFSHAAVVTDRSSVRSANSSHMSQNTFEYQYNQSLDRDVLEEIANENYEERSCSVKPKRSGSSSSSSSSHGGKKDRKRMVKSIPSIDTAAASESWDENGTLPPSHRRDYNGFCVDGFAACVGVRQQYSFMVNSPKDHEMQRTIPTNDSRLNFIDNFLLQKLRHKGSSLVDGGTSWLEPLDEDDENEDATKVVVGHDEESQLGSRIVEHDPAPNVSETPMASGCPSTFERIFDQLSGMKVKDHNDDREAVLSSNNTKTIHKTSSKHQHNDVLQHESYETYGTYSMTSSGSYSTCTGDNATQTTYGGDESYVTGEYTYTSSKGLTNRTLDDGNSYTTGDYTENSYGDTTKSTSSGELDTKGSESTDGDNTSYNTSSPGTKTSASRSGLVTKSYSRYSEGNSYGR